MGIRYTKVTREILNFIEDYGFITINICSSIFYKNNKQRYNQARVKLKNLYDNKVLKRWEHPYSGEYIYQFDSKRISDHAKYMLDLYAAVNLLVDKIDYFKLEEPWMGNARRNDAHIVYIKDDYLGAFLVEFEKYNTTSVKKIDEIFESNEVQEWYKERYGDYFFPTILLVTPTGRSKCKSETDKWESTSINYNLDGLEDIL